MRISARGFTLLEIMVVLTLIGIITSFALLSVGGGPQQRLLEETQRLMALIELHQQEAILGGETRGIQFSRTGYTFLQQNEKGRWQPPTAADTLIEHQLPNEITLRLWVEDRSISLQNPGRWPQVLLLPSGEATEFVVVFGFKEHQDSEMPRYRVASDAMGRLTTSAVTR